MKILCRLLLILALTSALGCSATRRESVSKFQERNGLGFIVNEETPYTGILTDYYANGQLKIERTYENGKAEGVSKMWHENGQLLGESIFKNGKLEGISREWYKNGKLRREVTYENGKREGISKEWRDDGTLFSECTYKNDNPGITDYPTFR